MNGTKISSGSSAITIRKTVRTDGENRSASSAVSAFPALQKSEAVPDHIAQLLPVHDADGDHRSEMQEYVKKQVALLLIADPQQILQDGQMSGTRYGQKLRDALNDAKKK